MIGSSIVSAIDAGPSPSTCDGLGYKNLSAISRSVLTIADRLFFKTLEIGWLRHGVAEIIKMAVVKDYDLFQQLESVGLTFFIPNSRLLNQIILNIFERWLIKFWWCNEKLCRSGI